MIDALAICRAFGTIKALDAFSLQVGQGEVVALLGPNGAGKTTCMRLMSGFLRPDSGQTRIAGFDVASQPMSARRALGYMPEHAPVYRESSVLSFLRFIAGARGMAKAQADAAIDEFCERLDLDAIAYRSIGTLSKGLVRRVAFAAAVMHRPPVLLLDEPTDGLDPIQKAQVRALIRELAKHSAVLLSTHQSDDVLALCPRTVIIAHGRKLADTGTDELLMQSRYHNAVSFIAAESIAARAALDGIPGISGFEQNAVDGRLYVFVQGNRPQTALIADKLAQKQVAYHDMRLEYGRLDEVFAKTVAEAGP